MRLRRRDLLKTGGAFGALALSGCAAPFVDTPESGGAARVLVVGGGYGGGTAAEDNPPHPLNLARPSAVYFPAKNSIYPRSVL